MAHYDVHLHEISVGQVAHDEVQNRSSFRFSEDYRRLPRRPVLGQYFEDDLHRTYRGKRDSIPPFFANLVPEGALRDLLRRSLNLDADADLPILVAVGRDLPGAVEVLPAAVDAGLFADSDEILGERNGKEPLGGREPEDLGLRFSLPGVQMKFSVLRESEKISLPVHGQLGDWIVKLESRRFTRLVENEYATMQWARATGMDVPDCQVVPLETMPSVLRPFAPEGTDAFMIRRYDREGMRRIHQEDFAQVVNLPPSHKYEQITYDGAAGLVRQIVGFEGYLEYIRRLAFMIASGNMDAHLKNWSLLYPDDVAAVLSPLYDQVATVAWPDESERKLALNLAGNKDPFQTDLPAFGRLAVKAGGDPKETLRVVDQTLDEAANAWATSVAAESMPPEHVTRLRDYWSRVPLLKPHFGRFSRG